MHKSLSERYGCAKADKVFDFAGAELDNLLIEYPNTPKGERNHTDKYIFPRVAIYRALKRELPDETAILLIDEAIEAQGKKMVLNKHFTLL